MKKIIFILAALPFFTHAQEVTHNNQNNQVAVDGIHSFNIERKDCGVLMLDCHYNVYDLEGNKVIRINHRRFNSPVEVTESNPEGTVIYYEYIFLTSKKKAEVNFMGRNPKRLAKQIVNNNLIQEGKLNEAAVEEFVLVYGTPFAERVRF